MPTKRKSTKRTHRNETVSCKACGWKFTVHAIPIQDEYNGAKWFCPHCGSPSPNGKIGRIVRKALQGDSNDAEHDALVQIAKLLDVSYRDPEDRDGN